MGFLSGTAYGQTEFLTKFLQPRFFQVTDELRQYIRDDMPAPVRDRELELKHIDMLFTKGMNLSGNELGTALPAICISVLNRTSFRPTFPLIGAITLPLPSEDSLSARSRIVKLPRYFFNDSPQDKWGDSAKLIHFFGSALLTYETGTKRIPDAIGVWIEEGESSFKLDSLGHQRDIFINRLGQKFGKALSEGRDVLPSDFLSADYNGK